MIYNMIYNLNTRTHTYMIEHSLNFDIIINHINIKTSVTHIRLIMYKLRFSIFTIHFLFFRVKIFMPSFRRPRTCVTHVKYCNRYSNNVRVARRYAICSYDCQILVASSVQRCDKFAYEIGEHGSYHRARGSLSDHKPTESSEYLRRMKIDQRNVKKKQL